MKKNGVSVPWKTHLEQKRVKIRLYGLNTIVFIWCFFWKKTVYNHHKAIPLFLETVHGTCNALLKDVALDAKETLYIAGSSLANFYIYNCPTKETV